MLTLIMGGSASGKSDHAEKLAASCGAGKLYYAATMKPIGEEAQERIEKHRKKRADKNFITVECPAGLADLELSGTYEDTAILLEDLGNLVANEQFDTGGTDDEIKMRIMAGIEKLCREAGYVFIVGDDVFSDAIDYGPETIRYTEILGDITEKTAGMADSVWQVIFGIALHIKDNTRGEA